MRGTSATKQSCDWSAQAATYEKSPHKRAFCSKTKRLAHFRFFENNVLARFRIVLFQAELFGFRTGVFLRGVEVTRSGGAFKLNL